MSHLLHQPLARAARSRPDHVAVQDHGRTMTYAELDARSSRLAAFFAANGVERGDRVGLYLPKSLESIVTIFAALKAGAVYVPVDPKAPPKRAAFILKDAGAKGLMVGSQQLKTLQAEEGSGWGHTALVVADDSPAPAEALGTRAWNATALPDVGEPSPRDVCIDTDLAYILYTSGSTGQPKGVMLSHRHALTFVDWAHGCFALTGDDRLSSHAPLHFDLSIFDIFAAVKAAATLVLVPDELAAFPARLAQFIQAERLTVWYSVPSALTMLVTRGGLADLRVSLRTILFAGEVFPLKYLALLQKAVPAARLYNLYGPTETNVCTYFEVPADLESVGASLPIGKACTNIEVFAVGDDGKRVAAGQEGELFARGSALLTGYWNRPELTAKSLRQNPLHTAFPDPAYSTGDIVRLGHDGNYTLIGRRDHMVKSRGYRIELGEVESVIYKHPEIAEAAVVAIPDETIGSRLVALVVTQPGASLDEGALKRHCGAFLPHYMVPERIVFDSELPKTSTGKADRQRVQLRVTAPAEVAVAAGA